MEHRAAMFREFPSNDRPPVVVDVFLPDTQRVALVSQLPLVTPGRFWLKVFSPEQFLHRKVVPQRAPICVKLNKYLERHVGDRDNQVSCSTRAEHSEDGADALPFEMLERLAAENRVISGNFGRP